MTEIGWGYLSQYEAYGRLGDVVEDYKIIEYNDAIQNYESYKKAAHAMFFARDDQILWDLYHSRAAVMMQMRFDGVLGFPGGLVDPGETPVEAMNRELKEEINLDLTRHKIYNEDHVVAFVNEKKNLILHFYVKEVSLDEFKAIEMGILSAPDYGSETLGIVRVPLFTMGDGYRGLPAFLTNKFAGNAREELLFGLQKFNILTPSEIDKVLQSKTSLEESAK